MPTKQWNGEAWRTHARSMMTWGAAALLILLLPLLAMQITDEVKWGLADFVLAGTLVVGAGLIYELAVRNTGSRAYLAGIGVALAAALLLIWINLAVGIIGSEDNPANLFYGAVLLVATIGSLISRFRPAEMARTMSGAGLVQAMIGIVALAAGYGQTSPSFPEAIIFLTAFFTGMWLLSAHLFRKAAREQERAS
ncbi:hypothetical protein [Chelativorans sp. J32]|uniref:hypothetical protein n=1 Tax=Chelativorans sp. J32 TaxID=935840 RepID=UPI0004AEA5AB|nr:hypothetical protein [Chelativorans sp. J32]